MDTIKALINYASAFKLQYGVNFSDAVTKLIADDMLPPSHFLTRVWSTYVPSERSWMLLLNIEDMLPVWDRLSVEFLARKELGSFPLKMMCFTRLVLKSSFWWLAQRIFLTTIPPSHLFYRPCLSICFLSSFWLVSHRFSMNLLQPACLLLRRFSTISWLVHQTREGQSNSSV